MTTKPYDTKCYGLAEAFLKDHPLLNTEHRRDGLAQQIQDYIESFIEVEQSNYEPPDGSPANSDAPRKSTDEPFGRQPQSVQLVVTGKEAQDVVYWVRHIKRACEFKGDLVDQQGSTQLTIYPRAVND